MSAHVLSISTDETIIPTSLWRGEGDRVANVTLLGTVEHQYAGSYLGERPQFSSRPCEQLRIIIIIISSSSISPPLGQGKVVISVRRLTTR